MKRNIVLHTNVNVWGKTKTKEKQNPPKPQTNQPTRQQQQSTPEERTVIKEVSLSIPSGSSVRKQLEITRDVCTSEWDREGNRKNPSREKMKINSFLRNWKKKLETVSEALQVIRPGIPSLGPTLGGF